MKMIFAVLALAAGALQATAQVRTSTQPSFETYESADIDASGNLRILTSNQKTITVPKDGLTDMGGVSADRERSSTGISLIRASVWWLASRLCTSVARFIGN
jgi:hypothetical protein